jgi:hypothetical protein
MLFGISTVDTYLVANNLVYIVQVPLVMPSVFSVFKVIPFPMQVEGTKGNYTLIQPEKEFVVIDNIKGVFAKLEQNDLQQCKRIQVKELICKQEFPLFSSHMSTDYEIQMSQPTQLVPQGCTWKAVELKETLWVNLQENTWLYVAPVPERLTVLCSGQEPIAVEIKGDGVLTFVSACTGYGNVIIRSLTVQSVNNTGKDSYQPLDLSHDCCEMTIDTLALGEINFETPINSIPNHDEELHVAVRKVQNVERLVNEQEANHTGKERISSLSLFGL